MAAMGHNIEIAALATLLLVSGHHAPTTIDPTKPNAPDIAMPRYDVACKATNSGSDKPQPHPELHRASRKNQLMSAYGT